MLMATFAALPGRAADGAVIYENNCASCHGMDGRARTPAGKKIGARDLAGSKLADDAIAAQIRNGAKTPQGAERMPAYKDRLKPEEVAAVSDFVKTFRKK